MCVDTLHKGDNDDSNDENVPAKSEDATTPVTPGCFWKENRSIYQCVNKT
jgi:hypothetical protein